MAGIILLTFLKQIVVLKYADKSHYKTNFISFMLGVYRGPRDYVQGNSAIGAGGSLLGFPKM